MFQVADAFRDISVERRDFAYQIGATFLFKQRWLYVYELMPAIFIGLRTVLSLSIIITVASEMAWGAGKGLGDRINGTRYDYDVPGSYAYALVAGVTGYGLNLLLRWAERYLIDWRRPLA